MTLRWQPGEHFGVLAPGCLGLLDRAVGAEVAKEVWTVLRREADLGSALGALTRRYDLRSMPAFAVVVIDQGVGHVAVRGDFTVEVDAAQPATVTGRGVFTWTERIIEHPRLVRIGHLAEADGSSLPAADAVLLAAGLSWAAAAPQESSAAPSARSAAAPAAPVPITSEPIAAEPPAPAQISPDPPTPERIAPEPIPPERIAPDPIASEPIAPAPESGESAATITGGQGEFDASETRWEDEDDGVSDVQVDPAALVAPAAPVPPADSADLPGRSEQVGNPSDHDEQRDGPPTVPGPAVPAPADYHVDVWGYTVAGLDAEPAAGQRPRPGGGQPQPEPVPVVHPAPAPGPHQPDPASPLVTPEQAEADRRSFWLSFETAVTGAGQGQPPVAEPAEPAEAAEPAEPGRQEPNPAAQQPNPASPPTWATDPLMGSADEQIAGAAKQIGQPDFGHLAAQGPPHPGVPLIDNWQVSLDGQFTPSAGQPYPGTGQPVDDTDATVMSAPRPAVPMPTTSTAAPDRAAGAELVLAVACPAGHVSPTTASFCTLCGGQLGSQAQWLTRPPLGMLRANTGQAVELTGVILVGREPVSERLVSQQVPTLFVVASPSKLISRTHLEIRVEGWTILGRNVSNTNEVPLRRPGEPEVNLARSALLPLAIGDVLDLGDGIYLTLEGPR